MQQQIREQILETLRNWDLENNGVRAEASTIAERFEIQTIRALAEGEPVTAERMATLLGMPVEIMDTIFKHSQALGGEWDEEGRLLGHALTLVPTQHRFLVGGNDLYVWCSFDALFLPGFLGENAQVESPDPLSGETIRLTIAPDGVTEFSPASAVISVVLSRELAERNGPQSAVCRQMHFFDSRESAETWQEDHQDVTILTIEEAYQIVRQHLIEPMQHALQAV